MKVYSVHVVYTDVWESLLVHPAKNADMGFFCIQPQRDGINQNESTHQNDHLGTKKNIFHCLRRCNYDPDTQIKNHSNE